MRSSRRPSGQRRGSETRSAIRKVHLLICRCFGERVAWDSGGHVVQITEGDGVIVDVDDAEVSQRRVRQPHCYRSPADDTLFGK